MLLQCFLRSCWKLKASRAFQLAFFKGTKAVIRQVGRRNVTVLFGLPFPRLLSSLPFFVCEELFCITPTSFPTHFLHLSEWRSWSQPCLPLSLDTHKCVQGGAKVRTGWWKWCPILNLLLDHFSFPEYGSWDEGTGTAAFLRATFMDSCSLSCFCGLRTYQL